MERFHRKATKGGSRTGKASTKVTLPPQKEVVKAEEKTPAKPVVVKEDFFIVVVSGYLGKGSGSTIYRVDVHGSISGKVENIKGEKAQPGFGVGAREAVEDFIRRNSSKLLNEVFDAN